MDRGDWQATVHRVTKELDTAQQLNNNNNKIYLLNSQNLNIFYGKFIKKKKKCIENNETYYLNLKGYYRHI